MLSPKEWHDYFDTWQRELGRRNLLPEVSIVDAVIDGTCRRLEGGEATWWPRTTLIQHPAVKWTWKTAPMFMGEYAPHGATSKDFPRHQKAVLAIAQAMTFAKNAEDMCAIMTLASCSQRHEYSDRAEEFLQVARQILEQDDIEFDVDPRCDRYLPIRIVRDLENFDGTVAWLIEEHVANLETWAPVTFRSIESS